ncbi:MAG: hypothetical protein JKY75_05535 [Erythrobacter sp.]|nr:hypothetical protein [Erythrobacter sp.]
MNFDKHKHGDKDFARIAEDFGIRLDEVYFIGDNGVGRDKRSAERYGVKWTNCDQFHPFATFGNEFDFNNILPESFEWDDEKVKKFTRIYAMGQKGQFYGYPKIDDKLDRFKELDQRGDRS